MNLNVIYEDNHIIVVVKPVGIPVQEDKSGDLDMLTIIKQYLKEKYDKKGNVYLGLVHRLDRMVGGVMVFAKTSKAASRLSEYIRNKDVKKKYFAIVNGKMEVNNAKIRLENFLVKNERTNMSKVVASKENKNVKVLCAGDGPLLDDIKEEIKSRNLDKVIEMLGFRTDINEIISCSDVGILMSYREGLPRNIMELMAFGKPVVGTNIRGIRDLIDEGKNGYLVQVDDYMQTYCALNTLITACSANSGTLLVLLK